MQILTILNFNPNESHLQKIKAAATGFEVLCGEDAKKHIASSEIVFGQLSTDQIKLAKNLKWLHSSSAGVDHFLQPEFKLPEAVVLTNSAGMHGICISEHMIAFTLMLMRNMHGYFKQQNEGKWNYLGEIKSIYGSNITVVGLGGIGSEFAVRCHAMGGIVSGVVRTPREMTPDYISKLYTVDALDQAIQDADVVAICLPGTKDTSQLFNKNLMLKMKKGAIIINVGRGSVVDQEALTQLIKNGHLAGAGLDVTTPEPLPKDSELWSLPNVLITPHVSGLDGFGVTADMIVDRFVNYLNDYVNGKKFAKVVDKNLGY